MTFPTALLVSALTMAAQPVSNPSQTSGSGVQVKHCLVSMIDHVRISSQEPGLLMELNVIEGSIVSEGDAMGKLYDADSRIKLEAASAEVEMAREQANSDVNIRAAKKMADVAKAEWDQAIEINRKSPGAISETEVRRLKLQYEKGLLQAEIAELEQRVAQKTLLAKEAAVRAAEAEIDRRQIKAPLDAIVDHVMTEEGEFLQPGQPVIELVRIDKLRVEAFLNAAEVSPHEVEGQNVTIEIEVRDPVTKKLKIERFQSKVTFVSKQIVSDGAFRIATDFENRQQGTQWAVWPGMTANMTIQVGGGAGAAASLPPRPVAKPVSRLTPTRNP